MGIFDKLIGKGCEVDKEVGEKGFEISSCSFECDGCNFNFPKSMKIETSDTLWNSSKPFGLHVIVPTNKTDWEHDATSEPNSFSKKINDWLEDQKFNNLINNNIKVNVSSQCTPGFENHEQEVLNGDKGDILILPQFIWIRNLHKNNLNQDLQNVIQLIVNNTPLPEITVKGSYKLEEDLNQSYMFLCSHRTRDKRCGITAPIMKKEIDLYTRELGFYRDHGDHRPNGISVSFINHIGGHKYAANLIIYNKSQKKVIWLARCSPVNVKPIIDECVLQCKVFPENTRLIQNFNKDLF